MTTADVVTLVIAAWGAGLSTVLAVHEWRRRQPRVIVRLEDIRFTDLEGKTKRTLWIRAMNSGEIPVTLHEVVICWEGGSHSQVYDESGTQLNLPYEVASGRCYEVRLNREPVAQSLRDAGKSGIVSVRALCCDALGRKYQSKAQDFDIKWGKEEEVQKKRGT